MKASALVTLISFSCFLIGTAEEDPTFGHSVHGEEFNEGPRQAAVLIPGTGDVHFEVTTDSDEAQQFFVQGVGQLHGFWDFEAERSFRQVALIDPECAMAYWGMAMANFKNDKRGKGFIEEATSRKEQASDREKMWIDGLAKYFEDTKADKKKRLREFVRSIEKIATEYPDDIEAQAFLMKQIYYNHGKGLEIPSHYAINLLVDRILTLDPDHPANHYQIHLWDKEIPSKALTAAANCGPSAPGIAHMWHMPGHIYSRLHRYQDAVWQQEASARIDHEHMIRYQIVPDQIHNFAHNNEWCIRNLNFLGDYQRSVELATNMISLPRLAKFKKEEDESTYDPSGSSWQYGRIRLRDTLVRFEQWDELIREAESGVLVPDDKSIKQNEHDRFVGIAKYETGNLDGANVHLGNLEERLKEKEVKRDKAIADAETKAKDAGKDEKGIKTAKESAEKEFKKDIETLQNYVNDLLVYQALSQTPPNLDAAKKVLPDLKDIAKARHAMLWHRAGDNAKAIELAESAVKSGEGEVLPLATQVSILHAAGKKEEAKKAFETLRTLAYNSDDVSPLIASLSGIAKDLGLPEKWRVKPEASGDLGERPPLDSLGPFRWTPPAAKPIALSNTKAETVTLNDFEGKPVLVIFFLGKGCSHCMEQLNEFAPVYDKYREAGIEILAVSTDSLAGLAETFQETAEGKNPFPFTMVSDPTFHSFRQYKAFDDFEQMGLHGTFLIDESRRIRWQNISFEPFMHPNWLLEECVRLLSLDKPES
ncbi:MAG: alkyl hydroperoxide reductase [Verrucomicrobiales bacterium]|nr:alkyl hydroperoxide reductase [Verrucomicrobiales bacterium]